MYIKYIYVHMCKEKYLYRIVSLGEVVTLGSDDLGKW